MPTDTKLKNLVINYLTKEQYDAIPTPNENELYLTSDMSSSGGGGVSPCLNLIDTNNGSVRTSITEEEKTNLEKGLYNSVFYMDPSSPEGQYMAFFPENAISFDGTFGFSAYNVSASASSEIVISSSSVYMIEIGGKSANGTYPITIEKQLDASFGGGSSGGGAIEEIEATHEASAESYVYKLSKEPTSDMYILKLPLGEGNKTTTIKVLMMAYNIPIDNAGKFKRMFFGLASLTLFSPVCLFVSSSGTEVTTDARSPLPPAITNDEDGYALVANFNAGGSARWELIPRYWHTVTLKTSAGAILWTQTLYHSKDTNVNSYDTLHSMFGGDLFAGYGEYAQLDLRGGGVVSDKLIKIDGTEATLASLGTIVYSDDCFLPK